MKRPALHRDVPAFLQAVLIVKEVADSPLAHPVGRDIEVPQFLEIVLDVEDQGVGQFDVLLFRGQLALPSCAINLRPGRHSKSPGLLHCDHPHGSPAVALRSSMFVQASFPLSFTIALIVSIAFSSSSLCYFAANPDPEVIPGLARELALILQADQANHPSTINDRE